MMNRKFFTPRIIFLRKFFAIDVIEDVWRYLTAQILNLPQFISKNYDPNHEKLFNEFHEEILQCIVTDIKKTIKAIKSKLKNFVDSKAVLQKFSSSTPFEKEDLLLNNDDFKAAKEKVTKYLTAAKSNLSVSQNQDLLKFFNEEFFSQIDKLLIQEILKKYKFSIFGLKFVQSFWLDLIISLKDLDFNLFSEKEAR